MTRSSGGMKLDKRVEQRRLAATGAAADDDVEAGLDGRFHEHRHLGSEGLVIEQILELERVGAETPNTHGSPVQGQGLDDGVDARAVRFFSRRRAREFVENSAQKITHFRASKCLLNLRSLWRYEVFSNPLFHAVMNRAFHTNRLLYTALFIPPVGDVGNTGRLTPTPTCFSKTPELHSHNLENRALTQPLRQTTTSEAFPLFLSRTTGTTVFSFNLLSFSYYPSHRFRIESLQIARTVPRQILRNRTAQSRPSLGNPSNPEKRPCFPRTLKPKDEYNQEEEKTAVSARPQCVVECGQSEDGFHKSGFWSEGTLCRS